MPLPKECTLQHVAWLTPMTYGAVAVLILWWAKTHKVKGDKTYHPAMIPTQWPTVTKYSRPVLPGRGTLYTNPLWIHWACPSRLNSPGVKEPNGPFGLMRRLGLMGWGLVAKIGVSWQEAKNWACTGKEVYDKSGLWKTGDRGALDAGVHMLEKAKTEENGEEGKWSLKGV